MSIQQVSETKHANGHDSAIFIPFFFLLLFVQMTRKDAPRGQSIKL